MTDDSRGQRRERPIWSDAGFTAFTAEGNAAELNSMWGDSAFAHSAQPVYSFHRRQICNKFALGGSKGVKATFSVCLTFQCFPVGKTSPAVGDEDFIPSPELQTKEEFD